MSHSVRSEALRGREPIQDLETGEASLAVGDVFERLWQLFISMRTGLVLMLALALLTLAGTLLIQAPAGLRSDAASYAAWLDGVRPKYGGWTGIFDALGLFSVFSSLLFRSLVLLLATSILACSVNRTPKLWRQATKPRTVAAPGLFDHVRLADEVTADAPQRAAVEAVQAELSRRGFRTIVTSEASATSIYADRFRFGPFGTVIAHLSLIVIMAGAIVGSAGFHLDNFAVAVGSTVDVGNGTQLSVKANSFTDSYYDNGSPADYASDLIVYENGQQVAQKTVRVNDPLRYGDVSFYQSFYGPAAEMVIRDGSGKTLLTEGVPLLWASDDGTKVIGQVDLPDQNLTAYVIGVKSGRVDPRIKPGQVQLEVFQGAQRETPVDIQVVDPGKPVTIAGLEFTFARERQFTGLIVSRDPGAPLVWLGALLLLAGVTLVFFFPARRLWARVTAGKPGSRVQIAALASHDVTFESSFRSLVEDVRQALEPTAAS